MTLPERDRLLHGVHFSLTRVGPEVGYFIGNIEGVPRLGVPALKMQDAGNGFRPTDPGEAGTTTAWPSLLALASTWDPPLVEKVAAGIAQEFKGKGANIVLGPSVNVHRVARNGRNFEYISGEDPHLGAKLAAAYVRGIQGEGVMAVVKHFAFNEQETERMTENSMVDERTAWELYYPPFQAAVDAGVGAVMCSYNRVNGVYACHSKSLLLQDLKQTMNFSGFVMSDWLACHGSDAIDKGLDQEQPGRLSGPVIPGWDLRFDDFALNAPVRQRAVNEAALRVLTSIYRLRLDQSGGSMACEPPNCAGERATNQRSEAHSALARDAAARATVLLKNAGGILPLDAARVKRVAILGDAANTPMYFSGGGSGRVPAEHAQSPLAALSKRAREAGIHVVARTPFAVDFPGAAAGADVAIVVVGTFASEGADRPSLGLDGASDALIAQVAASGVPTVVVMLTPGAVLTPWRENVAAILNLFFGGEEAGTALASILFGDVAPSGKLPVMFPVSEADTILPGIGPDVLYAEGIFTSYRSPTFKAAFPFGHGLSYTQFQYEQPALVKAGDPSCPADAFLACLRVLVGNVGDRAGAEVVQAYVQFREGLLMPEKVLRGFHRTALLEPGEAEEVLLQFSRRDLSVYLPRVGWVAQRAVRVHVGSSSADIRGVAEVELE